jgi:hypothetical protein
MTATFIFLEGSPLVKTGTGWMATAAPARAAFLRKVLLDEGMVLQFLNR